MIVSAVGGFLGIVILAVSLQRLDHSLRYLDSCKLVLNILYWLSSTAIFVLLGITQFFHNNPLILLVICFSVFHQPVFFSDSRCRHAEERLADDGRDIRRIGVTILFS